MKGFSAASMKKRMSQTFGTMADDAKKAQKNARHMIKHKTMITSNLKDKEYDEAKAHFQQLLVETSKLFKSVEEYKGHISGLCASTSAIGTGFLNIAEHLPADEGQEERKQVKDTLTSFVTCFGTLGKEMDGTGTLLAGLTSDVLVPLSEKLKEMAVVTAKIKERETLQ